MTDKEINKYMRLALNQALTGRDKDEVPIGAVIVRDGKVLARAYNSVEKSKLSTKHAEIIAIEKAEKKTGYERLDGAVMFVTLEPCPMCAGAIANARIEHVYFGAYEPKSGSAESKFDILKNSGLNHSTGYSGGIMQEECSQIIKEYFQSKRVKKLTNNDNSRTI